MPLPSTIHSRPSPSELVRQLDKHNVTMHAAMFAELNVGLERNYDAFTAAMIHLTEIRNAMAADTTAEFSHIYIVDFGMLTVTFIRGLMGHNKGRMSEEAEEVFDRLLEIAKGPDARNEVMDEVHGIFRRMYEEWVATTL